MVTGNAIEVRDVTKSFKIYYDKGSTIKEKIVSSKRRKYEKREILKGISFDVKCGEAIGLIGENGCGKSTTLKLLTKIMYPDSGIIEMKGRVSSLIELGAGFHPDMSGMENIFINASIFGLSRKEIESRLDDIIAFSELEEFMDNPIRTYSSGMYMRLAFSVAINVDADILLIDEILGVGDAGFQAKCFNKLREIKAKGTTIVIVSHSMGQIEQICERSIWIHDGIIRAEGASREVNPQYMNYMAEKRQAIADKEAKRKLEKENQEIREDAVVQEEGGNLASAQKEITQNDDKRWGNGNAHITKIDILDNEEKARTAFRIGSDILFKIHFQVRKTVEDAVVGIAVYRSDGVHCYGTNTRIDRLDSFSLNKDGVVELRLKKVNLLQGKYLLDFAIESGEGCAVDYYRSAATIELFSEIEDVGVVRIDHEWNIK